MPRALLVLLAFALVPGCTCSGVNRGDVNLISLNEEWRLGRELAAEVDGQTVAVPDPEVQAYVDAVGEALAGQTELADREWRFTVIADPTVNAFALPGGHVYVHAGLIAAAPDAAALAGVIGHEVAHVAARHSTERMVKAHGLSLIAGLVLGEDPGLLQQIVAGIVGQGVLAGFSRSDEAEADGLGVVFMDAAGYDPAGMPRMFEAMTALRQRRPGLLDRWFGSHPLGEDRVARTRALAEAASGEDRSDEAVPVTLPPEAAFEAVRARVRTATPAAP
jgi:predicted Zn-dependent protease